MKIRKLVILLPMVCSLVACGGGNNGGKKDGYTITFWHNCNDTNTAIIEAAARAFEAENPGITISAGKQSASYDVLRDNTINGIPADDYPDIFYGYPDSVQAIMEYDKVYNLDSLIDDPEYGWSEEKKADIIQIYQDEGRTYPVEGTYSIPFSKSTESMCYNESVLIGLNLSAEDPAINGNKPLDADYLESLTWEELFNHLAPAIIKYNNKLADDKKIIDTTGTYWSVFAYDSDANLFITLAEQYGYPYTSIDAKTQKGSIDFNTPEMRGLCKTLSDAKQLHYIETQGTTNAYTSNLFVKRQSLFTVSSTAGVAANCTTNSEIKVGLAPIPHAEGRDLKVISQGPSVAILDHDDDTRAMWAWRFYNYFLDNYSLSWSINTGYLPVKQSDYLTSEYLKACSYTGKTNPSSGYATAQIFNYIPTISEYLYTSPVFKGSAKCRTAVGSMLTEIMNTAGITDAQVEAKFVEYINQIKTAM